MLLLALLLILLVVFLLLLLLLLLFLLLFLLLLLFSQLLGLLLTLRNFLLLLLVSILPPVSFLNLININNSKLKKTYSLISWFVSLLKQIIKFFNLMCSFSLFPIMFYHLNSSILNSEANIRLFQSPFLGYDLIIINVQRGVIFHYLSSIRSNQLIQLSLVYILLIIIYPNHYLDK